MATGLSIEKNFTSNSSGEDLTLENLAFNMNVFSFKCRFTVLLKNEAYCARTEKVYSIKLEKCFIPRREERSGPNGVHLTVFPFYMSVVKRNWGFKISNEIGLF